MIGSSARLAIVGAGYWGANLVRVAHQLGVLFAICDENSDNLERAKREYPEVKCYRTYDEILAASASIDAIVLAVPAHLHASFAVRAIRAGKDVFVEKPLALTISEAEWVANEASTAGRKVFVGHLLLYHPAFRALLHLVRSGAVGEVVHVRSRRLSWGRVRDHENVWWSFATHDIAVVLAVLQSASPIEVTSLQTAHVRANVADFAYADYRFSNGQTAHIEVSWLDPDKSARVDVFGTLGVLTFSDSRAGAKLSRTPTMIDAGHASTELRIGAPVDIAFERGEPLKLEMQAFINWIGGGLKPATDVSKGLEVVRMLAMTQAVANDRASRSVGFAKTDSTVGASGQTRTILL